LYVSLVLVRIFPALNPAETGLILLPVVQRPKLHERADRQRPDRRPGGSRNHLAGHPIGVLLEPVAGLIEFQPGLQRLTAEHAAYLCVLFGERTSRLALAAPASGLSTGTRALLGGSEGLHRSASYTLFRLLTPGVGAGSRKPLSKARPPG
jgi:hypothetical protein